jgi:hypothetical protein
MTAIAGIAIRIVIWIIIRVVIGIGIEALQLLH